MKVFPCLHPGCTRKVYDHHVACWIHWRYLPVELKARYDDAAAGSLFELVRVLDDLGDHWLSVVASREVSR